MQVEWKATWGYRINAESGLAEQCGDAACTLRFYHAGRGDRLRLLDRAYEFQTAIYDLRVDEAYLYTYCYQPEENWSRYSGNLKGQSFGQDDFVFEDECFFRVLLRKRTGDPEQMREQLQITDAKPELAKILRLESEEAATDQSVTNQSVLTGTGGYEEELAHTIASAREKADEDSLQFLLLSDSHYTVNGTWQDTLAALRAVSVGLADSLQGLIHLGDLTDGMVPAEVTRDYVRAIRQELQSTGLPCWYVVGNHDWNYFKGNPEVLAEEDVRKLYLPDREKLYYAQDFPDKRLRMLFLDSFDPGEKVRYGYREETLDWLQRQLQKTLKDWSVLVFSHVPPVARLHYWSDEIRGERRLLQILRGFQRRSAGGLLAFVHGHNHADQIDYAEGFPIISIGCAKCEYFADKKPEGAIAYPRELHQTSQELWDVLTISTKKRTLDLVRFGAGEDRHISRSEKWQDMRKKLTMRKVITYGTFDLFHDGHYNLLKRAKELGDYLIVGVTTEHFDEQRGKINIVDPLLDRIENVRKSGFADEIIIEDHEGQKIEDVQKYQVDIFTLGSDWKGMFDYLKPYCEVVYLERTPGISSTILRTGRIPILRAGIVGTGRIAPRFLAEAKYVSGINVQCAYNPNRESAEKFSKEHSLIGYSESFEDFLDAVDAIYIASPHETHYDYAKRALCRGKHVLCEKPMALSGKEARELFRLAGERQLIMMDGIKTAYCPGFTQMISIAHSGKIGEICDVEACFSRLTASNLREMVDAEYGGAFLEFGSYTVLPIIKLLGTDYEDLEINSIPAENGVDLYSKLQFRYRNAMATSKTGIGVKSEGQLVIAGTKGYILAESPWWLTRKFQVRYEDPNQIEEYKPNFVGDGLRYEIGEFVSRINGTNHHAPKLSEEEMVAMADVVEQFLAVRSETKRRLRQENRDSGVRIWAHRGCSLQYPENTLPAFRAACEVPGITGIELDVQLSKDGEVVVFHDEKVDRLMDRTGSVCEYTLDELQGMRYKDWDKEELLRIPTLEEVLALVKPYSGQRGIQLNIELKNSTVRYPGMEEKVHALVRQYGMQAYVVYSSFNPDSLSLLKRLDPSVKTGILQSDAAKCVELAGEIGADALHPHADGVGEKLPEGATVRAWNNNEPFYKQTRQRKIFRLRELKEKGITDFITNVPEEYV